MAVGCFVALNAGSLAASLGLLGLLVQHFALIPRGVGIVTVLLGFLQIRVDLFLERSVLFVVTVTADQVDATCNGKPSQRCNQHQAEGGENLSTWR